MSASLRRHLDTLAQSGELLRIKREVDPRFELNAIVRTAQRERNLPVLFEKVRGTKLRVMSNVLGEYGRCARLLGVAKEQAARRWSEITKKGQVPTDRFDEAPATYHETKFGALPHPRYFEKDAGPYLTAGVITARDPDTGVQNLSYHRMQIVSDNTATDLSIATVGGVDKVNAWLRANGYADGMKLVQTTGELFAKYDALTPNDDRNAKTNGDHAYWLGELTPHATGRMIEAVEKRELPSKAGAEELLRMMRAQQAGARRLPHFLSVSVAHKTGDFPPVLANDVGVIYAKSGPIVVSFFLNEIRGNYGEAEDTMGRLAEKIVAYFDK